MSMQFHAIGMFAEYIETVHSKFSCASLPTGLEAQQIKNGSRSGHWCVHILLFGVSCAGRRAKSEVTKRLSVCTMFSSLVSRRHRV